MSVNETYTELDLEWVELITRAEQLGLTVDEIYSYFQTETARKTG